MMTHLMDWDTISYSIHSINSYCLEEFRKEVTPRDKAHVLSLKKKQLRFDMDSVSLSVLFFQVLVFHIIRESAEISN